MALEQMPVQALTVPVPGDTEHEWTNIIRHNDNYALQPANTQYTTQCLRSETAVTIHDTMQQTPSALQLGLLRDVMQQTPNATAGPNT